MVPSTYNWSCPCGFSLSLRKLVYPIRCHCGRVDPDGSGAVFPPNIPLPTPRPLPTSPTYRPALPGDALHLLLESKGYHPGVGCGCQSMIGRMNQEGIEWSRQNWKLIVANMVLEARNRNLTILGVNPPEALLRLTAKRWLFQALRHCEHAQQSLHQ